MARERGAFDLESGMFDSDDPKEIAASLKQAAEANRRRRAGPFQSAMSMLTVYINRMGPELDPRRRATLEAAKDELRLAFGRARKLH